MSLFNHILHARKSLRRQKCEPFCVHQQGSAICTSFSSAPPLLPKGDSWRSYPHTIPTYTSQKSLPRQPEAEEPKLRSPAEPRNPLCNKTLTRNGAHPEDPRPGTAIEPQVPKCLGVVVLAKAQGVEETERRRDAELLPMLCRLLGSLDPSPLNPGSELLRTLDLLEAMQQVSHVNSEAPL